MAKLVHGKVEIYEEQTPTGKLRDYRGLLIRDFEDGSYLVLENDKELLIETYYDDTITITDEEEYGA